MVVCSAGAAEVEQEGREEENAWTAYHQRDGARGVAVAQLAGHRCDAAASHGVTVGAHSTVGAFVACRAVLRRVIAAHACTFSGGPGTLANVRGVAAVAPESVRAKRAHKSQWRRFDNVKAGCSLTRAQGRGWSRSWTWCLRSCPPRQPRNVRSRHSSRRRPRTRIRLRKCPPCFWSWTL